MKRLLIALSICLTLSTQICYAYPLQIKVHNNQVNMDIFTDNGTPYFAVADVCEYLNFSSSFKNGVLVISSYDGRSKTLDSYASNNGLKMIESRAYITADVLRSIGCTVNYYNTANTYALEYTPLITTETVTPTKQEPEKTLLKRIYETDFTKTTTKSLLISAFHNILETSSTKSQQGLRIEVQRYVEYLQGENTNSNAITKYKLAQLNAASEEADINFLPFDIKWYIWHSQKYVTIDDTLSNEQSIDNIINGKDIKTNSNLLQVARLEATARNVPDQVQTYRNMRDYVYLQVR